MTEQADKLAKDLSNVLLPEIYPERYYRDIANHIQDLIDDIPSFENENVDECEGFLEDLKVLFLQLADIHRSEVEKKKDIHDHIRSFNWENYKDDDDKYYSLGEAWYQRLQWMKETETVDTDLKTFAEATEGYLPGLMDELEKYADS